MERNSLNEALKQRAAQQKQQVETEGGLDDSRRVKVLSPSRLVVKRFMRNRLAVVGICILIFVFAFSFLGPLFYPHGETEVFKHYPYTKLKYAEATTNKTVRSYVIPDTPEYPARLDGSTDGYIQALRESGCKVMAVLDKDSGTFYHIGTEDDVVYYASQMELNEIGVFSTASVISKNLSPKMNVAMDVDGNPIDSGLLTAAGTAFSSMPSTVKQTTFEYEGQNYTVVWVTKIQYELYCVGGSVQLNDGAQLPEDLSDAMKGAGLIAENIAVGSDEEILDMEGLPVDAELIQAAETALSALAEGETTAEFAFNEVAYTAEKTGDGQFSIYGEATEEPEIMTALKTFLSASVENKAYSATVNDVVYVLEEIDKTSYTLSVGTATTPLRVCTDYVFSSTSTEHKLTDAFKTAALLHLGSDEPFEHDGVTYRLDNANGKVLLEDGTVFATFSRFVVRDRFGFDKFTDEFKASLKEKASSMTADGAKESVLVYNFPQFVFDEKGVPSISETLFKDESLEVEESMGSFTVWRYEPFYQNYDYAPMSWDHPFGTDANGMDILARMMYGGQISLTIGFVVVFISMFIGVIMGGLAGYFGGWVDTLIMRIVEIFYCIPSYPILIILGGYMDAAKMDSEPRLYIMIAVLGVLGWAGTARLVRGQILSLREQEFMIATEATGVRVRFRIFRHLVPNVMPQLIVSATGSLGGVILTESSLSFLGLGVKYPLATWGNMLQFVTSLNEFLGRYIYIWMPVGVMICITVIAFNFVGDGLRDAFDPKMKR